MVSGSISLPVRGSFHRSLAVLYPLSVSREYLALRGGPPRFTPDFSGPTLLRHDPKEGDDLSPTGLSPSPVARSSGFAGRSASSSLGHFPPSPHGRTGSPYNPQGATDAALALPRFGLFPVRSPLLRESLLLSLPPGTEMLHFPGFASRAYSVRPVMPCLQHGRLPHSGIPGSTPVRRLPEAYRSLPRPSSPPAARASTICPY